MSSFKAISLESNIVAVVWRCSFNISEVWMHSCWRGRINPEFARWEHLMTEKRKEVMCLLQAVIVSFVIFLPYIAISSCQFPLHHMFSFVVLQEGLDLRRNNEEHVYGNSPLGFNSNIQSDKRGFHWSPGKENGQTGTSIHLPLDFSCMWQLPAHKHTWTTSHVRPLFMAGRSW